MAAENKSNRSVTLGILIALASILGALNASLVALWGAKVLCGPSAIVTIKEEPRKRPFWKRKAAVTVEQEAEPPYPFCPMVSRILDQLLPAFLMEKKQQETEPPVIETKKKNPLNKILSIFKRKKKSVAASSSNKELQTAFSTVVTPSKSQQQLIHRLANDFRHEYNKDGHLDERLNQVAWGGSSASKWWLGHDGTTLLSYYLRIMGWPNDLMANFPMKLCHEKCPSTFALAHTLQWRETFKPWLMCPGAIKENTGFAYFRGHARSSVKNQNYGHGMVWLRASQHENKTPDPVWYFRALLNALDMAVADNLQRSHQKVGKFNVVIDANGVSFGVLPKLADAKKGIVMLQDHYPNRLGIVVLANFSRVAEFLLQMIKPLITKEVRDKILILPKDAVKRQAILEAIIEKEYIPDYLGGQDTYRFDAKEYYKDKRLHCTDKEAREYITAMPYHA